METEKDAAPNDVEGEETVAHGLDAYPLDSLLIRTEPRTIVDVLRRIENGVIKLDPDFQRDFVWEPERQSRLIESILMRVPLPVFYVAEETTGKLVVVDGLQRLTTLRQFGKNELELELKNPELKGKTLETLSPKLRNRFEDGQLQFYIIDSKAPERVRLDIFDRVNSGVPLTRQQMRNALYSGPATAMLRSLAQTDAFQTATGWALAKKEYQAQQLDRQAINRSLAFRVLGWKTYNSDMEEFLGRALQALNAMKDQDRESHSAAFLRSMELNNRVFERHAFRKHTDPNDRKHPFNVVLFEVFSVLLAQYTDDRVDAARAQKLRSGFYALIQDPKFARSISAGTTSPESVDTRFEFADSMVRGALGDP